MADKVVSLKVLVDTKTGKVNVENLNKDLKNTVDKTEKIGKESKKTGDSMSSGFANAGSAIGAVNPALGGMIGKLGGLTSTLTKVTGGFRSMGMAIAATGLGLLVLTIAALAAAFKGSEEGQNKFAKIMAVIGVVTGNLMDLLADLGEKIIWVFENPKKALDNFGNALKTNIINRVNGMLELIQLWGKQYRLYLRGNLKKQVKLQLMQ